MPLGQFFSIFDLSVMKIALIFSKCLKVSPLTAHVNLKCLAIWLCGVQLRCNSCEIPTIFNAFNQSLEKKKIISLLAYVLNKNFP